MSRDDGKYSRLYWSVKDDEKFDGIRSNPAVFGTWALLLMDADAVWPSSASLPRWIRKRDLEVLVTALIVDLLPDDRYRIHGLDTEREKRAASARVGADVRRTNDVRPSTERTTTVPLAEPSTSQVLDKHAAEVARDPADIYWQLTGKYPTDKTLGWIDDLIGKYGSEPTTRHLAAAFLADRSVSTLLGRTTDLLRAETRQLDRKERETEQAALREKRSKPRVLEPWQEEYRAAVEAQYAKESA